jgi:hypothetical protein
MYSLILMNFIISGLQDSESDGTVERVADE